VNLRAAAGLLSLIATYADFDEGMDFLNTSGQRKMATELIGEVDEVANLLRAIANEKRLIILCHLLNGEKSVGEMERLLDLSQSALSQHLARLRSVRIVKTRRVAQTIFYSLNGQTAEAMLLELYELFGSSDGENGVDHHRSSAA
jgi:DNA-binding transcriptional ArsR family regulator